MTRHTKKYSHRDYWRLAITAAAIFSAAYLLIGQGSTRLSAHAPEPAFADASPSGLAIVPASGVSQAAYTGSYTGTYTGTYTGAYTSSYTGSYTPQTPSYTGSYTSSYTPGQSSYTPGQSSYTGGQSSYAPAQASYAPTTCWDGSTPGAGGTCPPCPTGYTDDGAGHCIPPNQPGFVGFTTTQGFTASGHLEVRPSLVRSGDRTRVYWNVRNVRDCTVRGTNGDGTTGTQWNQVSSGPSGVVTSPIGSRTDYTLFCHSIVGATPATITETRTVNVIPRWYEPSGE